LLAFQRLLIEKSIKPLSWFDSLGANAFSSPASAR
jgi:hypothetical protein